jgi:hypothetical protein
VVDLFAGDGQCRARVVNNFSHFEWMFTPKDEPEMFVSIETY